MLINFCSIKKYFFELFNRHLKISYPKKIEKTSLIGRINGLIERIFNFFFNKKKETRHRSNKISNKLNLITENFFINTKKKIESSNKDEDEKTILLMSLEFQRQQSKEIQKLFMQRFQNIDGRSTKDNQDLQLLKEILHTIENIFYNQYKVIKKSQQCFSKNTAVEIKNFIEQINLLFENKNNFMYNKITTDNYLDLILTNAIITNNSYLIKSIEKTFSIEEIYPKLINILLNLNLFNKSFEIAHKNIKYLPINALHKPFVEFILNKENLHIITSNEVICLNTSKILSINYACYFNDEQISLILKKKNHLIFKLPDFSDILTPFLLIELQKNKKLNQDDLQDLKVFLNEKHAVFHAVFNIFSNENAYYLILPLFFNSYKEVAIEISSKEDIFTNFNASQLKLVSGLSFPKGDLIKESFSL